MGSVCRRLERESRGGKARVGLGKVTRVPQARGSGLADLLSFLKPEASTSLFASSLCDRWQWLLLAPARLSTLSPDPC